MRKMESKFIPVRGNPSSPNRNTDYPFGWSVFFMPSPGGNGRAVRCLLLEEKVLSAARRMRWKGHDRPSAAGSVSKSNNTSSVAAYRRAAFPSRGRLASPSLALPLLRRFGRSRLYAPSHPRCAQPCGQLPAGQTAHERVKTVGTYRQPAAHARPQIRLGPRRQRRKTHLASPHLRSPFLS